MKLTDTDRIILASYINVIEGLADYLGPCYELVLHSLEDLDNSVIAIINGHYTGRKKGAPVTDLALHMLAELEKDRGKEYISYHTTTKNGQPLKSTTIAIRGENGNVIGLLCINLHLNTSINVFMNNIIGGGSDENGIGSIKEEFSENVENLIHSSLQDAIRQTTLNPEIPSVNKNKEIIRILYQKGIFNMKDAVRDVADALAISKNTVYMHIRAAQKAETDNS